MQKQNDTLTSHTDIRMGLKHKMRKEFWKREWEKVREKEESKNKEKNCCTTMAMRSNDRKYQYLQDFIFPFLSFFLSSLPTYYNRHRCCRLSCEIKWMKRRRRKKKRMEKGHTAIKLSNQFDQHFSNSSCTTLYVLSNKSAALYVLLCDMCVRVCVCSSSSRIQHQFHKSAHWKLTVNAPKKKK